MIFLLKNLKTKIMLGKLYINESDNDNCHIIDFDLEKGKLTIKCNSDIEDSNVTSTKVLEFLSNELYLTAKHLRFDIKIDNLTANLSKCIYKILNIIKIYQQHGGDIVINWYYDCSNSKIESQIEDLANSIDIIINHFQYEAVETNNCY